MPDFNSSSVREKKSGRWPGDVQCVAPGHEASCTNYIWYPELKNSGQ
jgi:hypothetical protein